MSEAFIRSQIEYYRRNLSPLCGNWHDRNIIRGLYQFYQAELRRLYGQG